jgi:peptidoglycan/LPS O-acetylase OafA/YrhL
MPPASSSRLLGLDILRVGAVLLVFGRHYPRPTHAPGFWESFVPVMQRGSWIGVDLFFVLSGFLVSGLLFREYLEKGSVQIGRFLIRRAFKIYPAFWAMIGGVLIFRFLIGREIVIFDLIKELLFVQNYFPALCTHTWSLAVEEHFYIFLSCLVAFLLWKRRARPFDAIPFVFVTLAIGCLAFRAWQRTAVETFNSWKHLYPAHIRMDSLMFGVLLSYWWHFKAGVADLARLQRWSGAIIFVGLLGLIPAYFSQLQLDWWVPVFGFTLFYFSSGMLLLGMLSLKWPQQSKPLRFVAWMGTHSYSVYLWHTFVFNGLFVTLVRATGYDPHWLVGIAYFLVVSWGLGILMAKLVEMPVLKVRDKFFPSLSAKKNQPKINPNFASVYAAQV